MKKLYVAVCILALVTVSLSQTMVASAATPRCYGTTLRQGARGNCVWWLQYMLAHRLVYQGAWDGVYGSQTAAAVRFYQQHTSPPLASDGVAGLQTQRSLCADMRGSVGNDALVALAFGCP